MRSARRLYRLYLVLALLGAAAVAGAVGAVARATSFRPESLTRLIEACRSSVLPHFGVLQVVILLGAAFGAAVVVRGVRSAVGHCRAARRAVARLVVVGELDGTPAARIIADPTPQAFCAGLLRPRIYVSTAAFAALTPEELAAVLEHEGHHAARRDPLRLLLAQVIGDALFFLPAMRQLGGRYAALAELAADEAAIRRLGDPQPLAAAMLVFGERPSGAVVGLSAERVDHLLGARPRWRLRASMLLGALVTVGALAAAGLLVLGSTRAEEVNVTVLLLENCFLIVLATALFVRGPALLRPLRRRAARQPAQKSARWPET